jgi:hypothetical protein
MGNENSPGNPSNPLNRGQRNPPARSGGIQLKTQAVVIIIGTDPAETVA